MLISDRSKEIIEYLMNAAGPLTVSDLAKELLRICQHSFHHSIGNHSLYRDKYSGKETGNRHGRSSQSRFRFFSFKMHVRFYNKCSFFASFMINVPFGTFFSSSSVKTFNPMIAAKYTNTPTGIAMTRQTINAILPNGSSFISTN